jgi:hypothetical protein
MAIVGPDAPGGGQAPQVGMGGGDNPLAQIQEILKLVETSEIDAVLVDHSNLDKVNVTITKVEQIITSYSQSTQNPELSNKWIGLETKLTKALKEFQSNLRLLLAGVTQMGQASAMIADQLPDAGGVGTPGGQAQNAPAPTPVGSPAQGNMDAGRKALPTGGE